MFRATPRVTLNTNEPSPGVLPVKKYKYFLLLNVFRRHAEMFLAEKYSVRFFSERFGDYRQAVCVPCEQNTKCPD